MYCLIVSVYCQFGFNVLVILSIFGFMTADYDWLSLHLMVFFLDGPSQSFNSSYIFCVFLVGLLFL